MTLATHGIVGAAAASLVPSHPFVAFVVAFASHLAIDSIPHRDYELLSIQRGQTKLENDMAIGPLFFLDLARTGTDAAIGLVLSIFIFGAWLQIPLVIVLIGVIGGVMPDFLQLIYWKTRSVVLLPLQRFHVWIQIGKERPQWPLWKGLAFQAVLVSAIIGLETGLGIV